MPTQDIRNKGGMFTSSSLQNLLHNNYPSCDLLCFQMNVFSRSQPIRRSHFGLPPTKPLSLINIHQAGGPFVYFWRDTKYYRRYTVFACVVGITLDTVLGDMLYTSHGWIMIDITVWGQCFGCKNTIHIKCKHWTWLRVKRRWRRHNLLWNENIMICRFIDRYIDYR